MSNHFWYKRCPNKDCNYMNVIIQLRCTKCGKYLWKEESMMKEN